MKIEYDEEKLYPCSRCLRNLPYTAFFKSISYPSGRDYLANYCKVCVRERNEELKENPKSSQIYIHDIKLSHELLSMIGYDISDLENNSIHTQFLKKYEDIINRPIDTEKLKKEKRKEALQRYLEKKRD